MLAIIEDTYPHLFKYYKELYDENHIIFESNDFPYILNWLNTNPPAEHIREYLKSNRLAVKMVRTKNDVITITFPKMPQMFKKKGKGKSKSKVDFLSKFLGRTH